LIALVIGASTIAVLPASAQTPPAGQPATAANPIEKARDQYEQGQFSEAIEDLRAGLASGKITGSSAREARELIARCLVRQGNRPDAKEAFKALLHLDPSYRPAAGSLPPDEQEVYDQAYKEFTSEQIEAGERVPASLAFTYGTGSGDNKDMAEIAAAGGGDDKYDTKPEFGGSVRFPVTPRVSLEIELQRFRATNQDANNPPLQYEIAAFPFSVSGVYDVVPRSKWRVNVFGGLGSMLVSTTKIGVDFLGARIQLSDQKNGFYAHGGVEGEYLIVPKLAVTGRLLARYAKTTNMYKDQDNSLNGVPLKGRDTDFSGFGAHIGLRAYIGY